MHVQSPERRKGDEQVATFPLFTMSILAFLLIGLIAGWFAGELMRGAGFGLVGDIIMGIIGALVGGYLFRLLGISVYGFWGSLVMAIIGAVVFLFIVRL